MQRDEFFVSVIVPVYNGERFLQETVQNILAQQHTPLEIIVVDDGSTDETAALAQTLPVRYVYQTNAGPSAARNRGLELAAGNMIAFKDVDDLWTPGALALLLGMFEADASLEIAQGLIQPQSAVPMPDSTTLLFEDSAEPYQFVNLGSALYRRELFARVGTFNEALRENEDADWFMRAWEHNISKQVCKQVVLLYRLHKGSMTHRQNLLRGGWARLFKMHRDRQRGGEHAQAGASGPPVADYIGLPPTVKARPWAGERFTIISNDCWGGGAYAQLGLIYQTPFVGVRIFAPCYIQLLRNPKQILDGTMEFLDHSQYPFANTQRAENPYPLALLNGSIEIHFVHEPDRAEALANWYRRMGRMKWDNLFFKFSQDPWACTRAHLEAFEQFPYPRKVCFTRKPYPEYPSTISIPDYFDPRNDLYLSALGRFDTPAWLAQKHGTELAAYLRSEPLNVPG